MGDADIRAEGLECGLIDTDRGFDACKVSDQFGYYPLIQAFGVECEKALLSKTGVLTSQ